MKSSTRRKKRRIKITNWKRFVTSILILASIIVIFNFVFANTNQDKASFMNYTVKSGDTIWMIAKEHFSDQKDIRKSVYEICKANDIIGENIYPGQILVIPD